jgi:hypothetical protein
MEETKKNANAKKWTDEVVTGYLDAIEAEVGKDNIYILKHALCTCGLKRTVWPYWKRTLENDDLLERMDLIETMLETKVVVAAMRKKIPAGIAIWLLKYVYKWGAKQDDSYV